MRPASSWKRISRTWRRSRTRHSPRVADRPPRSGSTKKTLLGRRRADHGQRVAGRHRGAHGDRQLGHRARLVGGDLVLPLHRLDPAHPLPPPPPPPASTATFSTVPWRGEASVSPPPPPPPPERSRRGARRVATA